MGCVALAQVGTRADAGNAHLAHVPLDGFAVDQRPCLVQYHCDPARAIKRMRGVDFVNAVFDGDFLRGGRHRLVIQAGAIQTEQLGLQAKRQVAGVTFDQRESLISR